MIDAPNPLFHVLSALFEGLNHPELPLEAIFHHYSGAWVLNNGLSRLTLNNRGDTFARLLAHVGLEVHPAVFLFGILYLHGVSTQRLLLRGERVRVT